MDQNKILINVAVYNRKSITLLCLENLFKYKRPIDGLYVWNDWSTEYDNSDISHLADKVFKLPPSSKNVIRNEQNINGQGIAHLRWHQFREFLDQTEYDFLYLTDSDAIHDPEFCTILLNLYNSYTTKSGKLPICLYNTIFHNYKENIISENTKISIRKSAPGISHFYDRDMVTKIVSDLNKLNSDPDYGWDYTVNQQLLKLPFLTSKISYLEHFGALEDSMHTKQGEWDRDRALEPTEYLKNNRSDIIEYLENKRERSSFDI